MIENFIGTKSAHWNCYKDWKVQLSFVGSKMKFWILIKKIIRPKKPLILTEELMKLWPAQKKTFNMTPPPQYA